MNTWEIESITSVPRFLAAVAEFLPIARTVSFEINKPCAEAVKVYAKHHARVKLRPFRDTLFPKTQLHHCVVSSALADDLEQLLRGHDVREVLWHVKGFSEQKLLFSIHDADMGDSAFFSSDIADSVVRAIGTAVGRQATKLQTQYDWDEDCRK